MINTCLIRAGLIQRLFGLLAACLIAAGCSVRPAGLPESEVQAGVSIQDKEPPIGVDIVSAAVIADALSVKVKLEPKTKIEPGKFAVSLLGLDRGSIIAQDVRPLSEILGSETRTSEPIVALLSVPAAGINEYQVRCSWGDELNVMLSNRLPGEPIGVRAESKSAPAKSIEPTRAEARPASVEVPPPQPARAEGGQKPEAPARSGPGLVLRDARVARAYLPCGAETCPVVYTVDALLMNRSETTVSGIALAAGLFWAEGSGAIQREIFPAELEPLLPSEEEISLEGFTLAPGAEKKIHVRIDTPVPDLPTGRFVPNLRILRGIPVPAEDQTPRPDRGQGRNFRDPRPSPLE